MGEILKDFPIRQIESEEKIERRFDSSKYHGHCYKGNPTTNGYLPKKWRTRIIYKKYAKLNYSVLMTLELMIR